MVMITHTHTRMYIYIYIYIYMKTKAWGRYWRENVMGREYQRTLYSLRTIKVSDDVAFNNKVWKLDDIVEIATSKPKGFIKCLSTDGLSKR